MGKKRKSNANKNNNQNANSDKSGPKPRGTQDVHSAKTKEHRPKVPQGEELNKETTARHRSSSSNSQNRSDSRSRQHDRNSRSSRVDNQDSEKQCFKDTSKDSVNRSYTTSSSDVPQASSSPYWQQHDRKSRGSRDYNRDSDKQCFKDTSKDSVNRSYTTLSSDVPQASSGPYWQQHNRKSRGSRINNRDSDKQCFKDTNEETVNRSYATSSSNDPQTSSGPYGKQQDRKSRSFRADDQDWQFQDANRDTPNTNDTRYDDDFDKIYKACKHRYPNDWFTKVKEIEGDLFDMPQEYSLAHCVAEDMLMGSGIAVEFKRQFKRQDELYSQRPKQGGLAVLNDKGRFIYYLVTKKESKGKPTMLTMWKSLQKLRQHIEANGVEKLAIPRIGCGLDQLEWSAVKYMLERTFRNTDVQITVCNFQQIEDGNSKSNVLYKVYKCFLKNVPYPITEIESGTAIVYFGTEDGFVSDDIRDLDKKFRIMMDYKCARKSLGSTILASKHGGAYLLCGFIVRKTNSDPFDFISFTKCLNELRNVNKHYYVAFQAFLDPSDDLIVIKVGNVLRHFLRGVEIYVCWGGELNALMPIYK